jgi:hypothetical protein
LEGDHPKTIWIKFDFISSSGTEEEDFQRFPIVQPIRSNGSHLGCKERLPDTILKEIHPRSITFNVQFVPVVLEKIKM